MGRGYLFLHGRCSCVAGLDVQLGGSGSFFFWHSLHNRFRSRPLRDSQSSRVRRDNHSRSACSRARRWLLVCAPTLGTLLSSSSRRSHLFGLFWTRTHSATGDSTWSRCYALKRCGACVLALAV